MYICYETATGWGQKSDFRLGQIGCALVIIVDWWQSGNPELNLNHWDLISGVRKCDTDWFEDILNKFNFGFVICTFFFWQLFVSLLSLLLQNKHQNCWDFKCHREVERKSYRATAGWWLALCDCQGLQARPQHRLLHEKGEWNITASSSLWTSSGPLYPTLSWFQLAPKQSFRRRLELCIEPGGGVFEK